MKHWLLFFLAFVGVNSFAQQFQNADFEQITAISDSAFAYWRSSIGASVQIDSVQKSQGKYAATLEKGKEETYAAMMQILPIQTKQPIMWEVSAKMRLEGGEKTFASLYVSGSRDKKRISFTDMGDTVLREKKSWKTCKLRFFSTPQMDKLNIGVLIDGEGKVWIDDISLKSIDLTTMPNKSTSEVRSYLKHVYQYIEKNSIRRDSVDFATLKATTNLLMRNAQTTEDCYPIVEYILGQLGDNHSFLMRPQSAEEWSKPAEKQSEETKSQTRTGLAVYMDKQFAYLQVPTFSSGNVEVCQTFADSMQKMIQALDQQQIKGWIIDLRQNQGGNCWPMLLGIGPILGDTKYGYFVDANNKKYAWYYKKGKVGLDKGSLLKLKRKGYQLTHQNLPIAVLTGDNTASSGEVVTVAFRAAPNCRSFGAPTHGLSTGNSSFPMKDGSRIFLTTSIYADRTGKLYGSKIQPDVLIPNTDEIKPNDFKNDATLKAAKDWILGVKN